VTLIAAAWYALAASLLAVGPIAARYRRVRRWLGTAAGATFVLLGIRIAAD
jgi:threonine/homoserine/homoserine lactone efflux protein